MNFLIQDNQLVVSESLKLCKTCGKPMLPRFVKDEFYRLIKDSPLFKSDQVRFTSSSWDHPDICTVCFQDSHEYRVLCEGCQLMVLVDQLRMRKYTSYYDDYDSDHLCIECAQSGDKVIEFLTEGERTISTVELFTDGKWEDWQ